MLLYCWSLGRDCPCLVGGLDKGRCPYLWQSLSLYHLGNPGASAEESLKQFEGPGTFKDGPSKSLDTIPSVPKCGETRSIF